MYGFEMFVDIVVFVVVRSWLDKGPASKLRLNPRRDMTTTGANYRQPDHKRA